MAWVWVGVFGVVAVAAAAQAVSGFGFALIGTPLVAVLAGPKAAVVGLTMVGLVLVAQLALRGRGHVDRPTVGAVTVAAIVRMHEHQRQVSLFDPCDERREARRELRPREREHEHLLARPAQHRDLVVRRFAQTHLAGVDGVVEPLPPRLAERVQQQLGHILQAGGAVEVHEERLHRQHRRSVPAPSRL